MKVVIREPYFNYGMKIFGFICPLISWYIVSELKPNNSFIIVGISCIPIILMYTTYYVNEINLKEKTLLEYFVFAGIQTNKKERRYNELSNIYVKNERSSQRIETRTRSINYKTLSSSAILKYDDEKSFTLFSTSSAKKCHKKIKRYNKYLGLPIIN